MADKKWEDNIEAKISCYKVLGVKQQSIFLLRYVCNYILKLKFEGTHIFSSDSNCQKCKYILKLKFRWKIAEEGD